jgi:ABC-2 type transport system permease protein
MSPLTHSHAAAAPFSQLRSIFLRELKTQRKAMLGWTVPAFLVLALTLALQPKMAKDASLLEMKMAAMPPEMIEALGMSMKNLGDPVAWLAMSFIYPALLGGLMAALIGASLLSREDLLRTSELLLVQPVPRHTVLLGKLCAGVVMIVVYNAVLAVGGVGVYAAVDVVDYNHARYFGIFGGLLLAQLALLCISTLVSVVVRAPRGAVAVGLGVTFALWGAGVAGAISETLKVLTWLSPFKATDATVIAETGAMPQSAWALPVVVVVSTAVAIWSFQRKDIHG